MKYGALVYDENTALFLPFLGSLGFVTHNRETPNSEGDADNIGKQ